MVEIIIKMNWLIAEANDEMKWNDGMVIEFNCLVKDAGRRCVALRKYNGHRNHFAWTLGGLVGKRRISSLHWCLSSPPSVDIQASVADRLELGLLTSNPHHLPSDFQPFRRLFRIKLLISRWERFLTLDWCIN